MGKRRLEVEQTADKVELLERPDRVIMGESLRDAG